MSKRLVLVVRHDFDYAGKRFSPGAVISDPDEIAFMRANHPEKVTATMHDCEEPAPAPVSHGTAGEPEL